MIMRSNAEYYNDDDFVRKTIEDFLSLNILDISRMESGKDYLTPAYSPVNMEKLDRSASEEMSYIDLCGLITNSESSGKYRFSYPRSAYSDFIKMIKRVDYGVCDSYESYLDEVSALDKWIFANYPKKTVIKRFMDIPLKRLYGILMGYDKSIEWVAEDEYKKLNDLYKIMSDDLGMKDKMADENKRTVKDVLSVFRLEAKRPWKPSYEKDKMYIHKVIKAYEMEGIILVKCFRHAFPESYDYNKLRMKYKYARQDTCFDEFLALDDELPFN